MCQTADCGLPDGHTKLKVGLLALRYSLPGGAPLSPPYLRELPCLPCLVLPCLTLPCPALLPCAPPPPLPAAPLQQKGTGRLLDSCPSVTVGCCEPSLLLACPSDLHLNRVTDPHNGAPSPRSPTTRQEMRCARTCTLHTCHCHPLLPFHCHYHCHHHCRCHCQRVWLHLHCATKSYPGLTLGPPPPPPPPPPPLPPPPLAHGQKNLAAELPDQVSASASTCASHAACFLRSLCRNHPHPRLHPLVARRSPRRHWRREGSPHEGIIWAGSSRCRVLLLNIAIQSTHAESDAPGWLPSA
ncbi:hypothetical protein BGZ57DRAFT_472486 [Hyaloscypha finlandica]|nr:hypothetical protein BGZ57DRAFT_472486 [Hyaloscypha finlandica]